jgi:hypothetical protein
MLCYVINRIDKSWMEVNDKVRDLFLSESLISVMYNLKDNLLLSFYVMYIT